MCCTNPLAGAAFMAVRSVVRPNERVYFLFESSGRPRGPPPHTDYVASILVINVLHASTVGMGFIPILLQRGLFSLAKPLRTLSQEMEFFPTKTGKTLAVMQWLRPMFLPCADLLRSKLRQVGTGKKQPSFLRLASRHGKPEKQLTPNGVLHHYNRIYLHHTAILCKK